MQLIKNALVLPSVLPLLSSIGDRTPDTDACDVPVCCVFLQKQFNKCNKTAKPIEQCSRSLADAERRYETTQTECLSIVWAKLPLRAYFKNTIISIRMDYNPLKQIPNLTDRTKRLAQWRLRLSEYKFNLIHRAEIKLQAAYALSRLQTTAEDRTLLQDVLLILAIYGI